ncbi:MAG: RpiB/LacA/LacB family sugar-phosphate isomerase [Microgenomates group bacterium]|jgi:ribose 5-phosphate isomerase B
MIYLASDHGGFELKEQIKDWLKDNNYQYEDLGAKTLDPGDDYPDFVIPLAQKISAEPDNFGIILGRSGNGEAIVANKVKGVRAALAFNEKMAQMAREHNDANVLSIGADYLSVEEVEKIVKTFLETPFSEVERHVRRLKKIEELENAN